MAAGTLLLAAGVIWSNMSQTDTPAKTGAAPLRTPSANNPVRRSVGERKSTRHQSSEARDQALEYIGELARAGEIDAAWEEISRLSPPLDSECAEHLCTLQAAIDPLGAWQQVMLVADSSYQPRCHSAILRHGSDAHLPDLARLALETRKLPDRENLLKQIIIRWALQDPAALASWPGLDTLPPEIRDQAASHIVLQGDAINRSPEVAAAWAETITDPGLRRAAMTAAIREWSREDPKAARDFATRSTTIEPAHLETLLETARGP